MRSAGRCVRQSGCELACDLVFDGLELRLHFRLQSGAQKTGARGRTQLHHAVVEHASGVRDVRDGDVERVGETVELVQHTRRLHGFERVSRVIQRRKRILERALIFDLGQEGLRELKHRLLFLNPLRQLVFLQYESFRFTDFALLHEEVLLRFHIRDLALQLVHLVLEENLVVLEFLNRRLLTLFS